MLGRVLLIAVLAIVGIIAGAVFAPVRLAHIQLPAEPVGHIGSFVITNTMTAAVLASLVVLFFFSRGTSSMQMVPRGIQNFVEFMVEFVMGLCESVAGKRNGRQFFPLTATIFFFILTSNWLGLLPGYGTIGYWHTAEPVKHAAAAPAKESTAPKLGTEKSITDSAAAAKTDHPEDAHPQFIGYLRSAATDLNTTLAIALVACLAIQYFGARNLGGEYLQKFFNFKEGPIGVFVGLLELVAEFGRVISFTFRLFGNIFAGEVVLAVITFLLPWVVLVPFLGIELFVGFIQALVFAMLTLVFASLASTSHKAHDNAHEGTHH